MAAIDYVGVVQQLYVSYFGRPADYFGLKNFTEALNAIGAPTTFAALNAAVQADAAGTSELSKLANSFNKSAESDALYGTDTSQVGVSKFVEAIYLNVLGRAPDVEGWAFWVGEIMAGKLTRANAAMAITEGAMSNTSPQGLKDALTVANKLDVASNFTDALDTVAEINGYSGNAAAETARGMLKSVTDTTDPIAFQATVEATVSTIVANSVPSTTTTLTTGVDTVVGTANNDVVNGTLHATDGTLTALDSIDGAGGNDTLNVNVLDTTAFDATAGIVVAGIENIVVRGASDLDVDTTSFDGVASLKVTQSGGSVLVEAGSDTAVEVSGVAEEIIVDGGSTVSATTTKAFDVAIGSTTAATGNVTVTHANLSVNDIAVSTEAGATVTASKLANVAAGTDVITVNADAGAVTVAATGAAYAGAASQLGDIVIEGGTTVAVTVTATSSSAAANDADANVVNIGNEVTLGAIAVTGTTSTTEVTVTQTASIDAEDGVAAIEGVEGEQTFTFTAAVAGDVITVGGLSFTASKNLTAAQVAAAFANVSAEDVQAFGPAGNGIYTGTYATGTSFTTGAVVNTAGVYTVVATTSDSADVALTGDGVFATAGALSAATDAVDMEEGVVGVIAGAVTVDSGTGKIAKVTIDGMGAGSTITSDDLVTLSVANTTDDLVITNTKATTLALSLNNVASGSIIDDANGTYTALNITTGTASSNVDLDFAGVEALTIAGTKAVTLTGSTLTALKTVVITGSAGVTNTDTLAATTTSVNASGTSGAVTLVIDNGGTSYTGGSGADSLTYADTDTTKGATLGAGDDKLTLASGTTSLTGAVNAGDGTDTLVMVGADAATASAGTTFEAKIDGFEKLQVTATGTETVDLANMDDIKYVITSGGATALTLDNMLTGGTIEHTAAATLVTANVTDAADTEADVLNVVLKAAATIAGGEVVAEDVETINVTSTDTNTVDSVHTVTLTGAALTTVKVTGNAGLTLTLDADSDLVTMIDGSAMTGALTAESDADVDGGTTIKGGSGDDVLTANGTEDVLNGGAGADTLIAVGDLASLTGGAGDDTFDVGSATTNVNGYASIKDLTAGDVIKFSATAADFVAAKVTLAGTAVFQDLANKAIATTDTGDLAWFQFGGNTYIVENISNDATEFVNGSDVIVQIIGTVDLTKSSLSADFDTLMFI